ncbi:MAG TPA: hypothetical protein PKE43_14275, partial [Anaerolineales bacterium]|nr:hypothetical protein [Anaerolineales bacterium]
MAIAKSGKPQHECHEFTNGANKSKKICEIRPFALFAFQVSIFVKRLCYCHTGYGNGTAKEGAPYNPPQLF